VARPSQSGSLSLFVASPGDVQNERNALTRVADELNRTVAAGKNLVIAVVRWRTHAHPDIGEDPQDVVNRQIGASVIFLGILWNRVGTPTKRAQSGTMEESSERATSGKRASFVICFCTSRLPPLMPGLWKNSIR